MMPRRHRPRAFQLRAHIVLISLILLPVVAHAQEAAPPGQAPLVLTLDKAIDLALSQNRDVLIAAQDRSKAAAQIGEAKSGVFPSLDISASYIRNIQKPVLFLAPNSPINPTNSTASFELGSNNAYSVTASLSQTLYDKKVHIALDIARTFGDFAQEAYRGTQQNVTLAVKRAFYGVLLAEKLVEANRQGLEIVRANFENVQSHYRHGTVAEYDMLRAEVEVANTEPLLVSAENDLELARNSLKNLLGLALATDIKTEGEFAYEEMPAALMDQARRDALTNNVFIRQLALSEALQKKNIGIERAHYFPTLSLVGAYSWQTEDNTFKFKDYAWAKTSNLGLRLSLPLFDGRRTNSRTRQARNEYEKAHLARLKAEEGLRIQIESAELRMAEAKQVIIGQEKGIEQARRAVSIAQTRFANGVGTQLELLDSQVALTRAETNYAVAVYDYLVAEADWRYAVGL